MFVRQQVCRRFRGGRRLAAVHSRAISARDELFSRVYKFTSGGVVTPMPGAAGGATAARRSRAIARPSPAVCGPRGIDRRGEVVVFATWTHAGADAEGPARACATPDRGCGFCRFAPQARAPRTLLAERYSNRSLWSSLILSRKNGIVSGQGVGGTGRRFGTFFKRCFYFTEYSKFIIKINYE